ncbi:uncharacterized protein LOC143217815 [Lasioglossum baleicum]|uniref:uncharacterized protein LOC143217815 n=1 Tax=Lasioglossum baleicum TaxID=434251 RepID=UPI003FCCD14C
MKPRVLDASSDESSEEIDLHRTECDVTDANTSREDALQALPLHGAPKTANTIGDDNNEFFYPRCEYKWRFKGTSAFAMSDPDHWGTYFRSTSVGGNCDRIAKLVNSGKTYKNRIINKSCGKNEETIPPSKTGCIRSTWVHPEYKNIFDTKPIIPKEMNKNNDTLLYDQLLRYKTDICDTVVTKFSELEISDRKIDVYFENDYPCIMVQIKEFAELFPTQEQGSLYNIVLAYFIAITNCVAYRDNIPIEVVNRASFGHDLPSVSETGKSFRISIGVVPKCYAEVLVQSLKLLNTELLVPLLNKDATKTTLKLGFSKEEIKRHNDEVNCYNEKKCDKERSSKVERWEEHENLINVLCKIGDSSGRKVSYQITRSKKYIDLLADYVHNVTLGNTKDLAKPLREMLRKLTCTNKGVVTIDNNNDDYNNSQFVFHDEENQDIKNDKKFWGIIRNISLKFERVDIKHLCDAINSKKITGLYRLFEKANLEFIRNSSYRQSEEGYGSSSDCEVSFENTRFHSKKITLATGMRAFNVARFLSIYKAGTRHIDTKYMYYETDHVEKKKIVQDINQSGNLDFSVPSGVVKCIDLNHCAANGPNSKVDLEKIKDELNSESVMILDYTSATTEKISEAIRLFIEKVPILLLVISGIKNEQVGADMNPYGTLRIVTTDPNELNKLYYSLIATLIAQEKLPRELHNIRKAYKDAGAVVTSAAIYTKDRGYDYQPNTDENDSDSEYVIDFGTVSDELKKIADLFSGEYEEERNNLTQTHRVSLNSIISWDLKKIKFLGSDDVISVINSFDDNQDIFDQIIKWYDSNPNLTCDIVEDIVAGEEDIIDTSLDFEDLAKEYKRIKKECYVDIGENIIDAIVREESYDIESYRAGFAYAKMAGLIDSRCSSPRSSLDEDRMSLDYDTEMLSSSNDDNSTSSDGEGMDCEP